MSLETEEIYLINSTRIGGEIHKCIGSVNFNNTFLKTLDDAIENPGTNSNLNQRAS